MLSNNSELLTHAAFYPFLLWDFLQFDKGCVSNSMQNVGINFHAFCPVIRHIVKCKKKMNAISADDTTQMIFFAVDLYASVHFLVHIII